MSNPLPKDEHPLSFQPNTALSRQGKLLFVTYTDDPQEASSNPAVRETIRRRATQVSRPGHQEDRPQSSTAATSTPRPRLQDGLGRFRSGLNSRRRKGTIPQRDRRGNREQSTPRATPPSPVEARLSTGPDLISHSLGETAQDILHYYRQDFRFKAFYFSGQRDWMSFAVADELMGQAALSLMSLDRDLRSSSGSISSVTLYHRQRAYQLLRDQVPQATQKTQLLSLGGAVALLVFAECLEGDLAACLAHFHGLIQILRRVESAFPSESNSAVLEIMNCADISYCSTWLCSGRLPGTEGDIPRAFLGCAKDTDEAAYDENAPECRVLQSHRHAMTLALGDTLNPALLRALEILQAIPPEPMTCAAFEARRRVTEAMYALERALLEDRDAMINDLGIDDRRWLSYVFKCAAHLYVAAVLRSLPTRSRWVLSFRERLAEGLNRFARGIALDLFSLDQKRLLFWSVMVETAVLGDSSVPPLINVLAIALDIASLDQLLHSLRLIAWAKKLEQYFTAFPYVVRRTSDEVV